MWQRGRERKERERVAARPRIGRRPPRQRRQSEDDAGGSSSSAAIPPSWRCTREGGVGRKGQWAMGWRGVDEFVLGAARLNSRAPAIKAARPELKFHHSTPPPSPLSLPHHSTLSRAPPGGRNCCRRAAAALHRPRSSAAAEEVDDQSVAVRTLSLSLFLP